MRSVVLKYNKNFIPLISSLFQLFLPKLINLKKKKQSKKQKYRSNKQIHCWSSIRTTHKFELPLNITVSREYTNQVQVTVLFVLISVSKIHCSILVQIQCHKDSQLCYFPAIFIFTFPCSTQQPLPNKKKAITMSCQKIYIHGSEWPSGNGSLTYSKHYCFNIGKDLFNETMSKPVETIKQKRLCPIPQSFHHNKWQSDLSL